MKPHKQHTKKTTKTDTFPRKKATPREFSQDNDINAQHEEVYYGKHAVSAVLAENKQINKVFVQKGITSTAIQAIMDSVKQRGVVYQEVPKTKLDELTQGANHQGIVMMLPPFDYQTLEDCYALAEQKAEPLFLLILDGIEDPHNLGSILRTADATGVHGVIIPKRRAVGLTGVVAKTSTGAIEHVPVVRVTNLVQTIETLKARGVWVFATDMAGEDMRQWNSQGDIALVIGNEGQGVSRVVKEASDGTVTIPMIGHVQSLNASVAAGVLMYEVARHRIQ